MTRPPNSLPFPPAAADALLLPASLRVEVQVVGRTRTMPGSVDVLHVELRVPQIQQGVRFDLPAVGALTGCEPGDWLSLTPKKGAVEA